MRTSKFIVKFTTAVLTFSLGVFLLWFVKAKPFRPVTVIVPQASWEPIYFREINAVAKHTGLTDLRTVRLPEGDLEVRVWWGFGLSPLEGVVLRRDGDQWSAKRVKADRYYEPQKAQVKQLGPPKSGWGSLWRGLVERRVLTLPDASEIGCNVGGLDGMAYVVESNQDGVYRTYMYDLPMYAECEEAKRMTAIGDTIFEEFVLAPMDEGIQ